jgi:hypothetical protein
MKNKMIILMSAIILLISIGSVISEEYLWTTFNIDPDESTTNRHSFYWFEDTSPTGIGANKDIPITFYYVVQSLPYTLDDGTVDWCNFTISHFKNIYGGLSYIYGGGISFLSNYSTATEIQNFYFDGSLTSGVVLINVRSRDTITADMICHYTNLTDLYDPYEQSLFIGMFTTYMPSFECEKCEDYDFEQLTYNTDNAEDITQNQLEIYDRIQTAIDWDFQIWIILSWVIKIVFLLLAVGLIFSGVYFFYIFLKKISQEI